MAEDKMSTAESLRSTRTYGQVRCHNPSCTARITPPPGQKVVKCELCGSEWRIFWVNAGLPRIQGPVWETSQKLAQEILAKRPKKKKEEK